MRLLPYLGPLALGVSISTASAQTTMFDQGEALGPPNWCGCRMDPGALTTSQDQDGTKFGRITVEPSSVGGNKCRSAEVLACKAKTGMFAAEPSLTINPLPDDTDDLGPSLIRPTDTTVLPAFEAAQPYPKGGPHCTDAIKKMGAARNEEVESPCIQRQEMSIQEGFPHRFDPAQAGFEYTMRFRMPGSVSDTKHSIRWVLNQWKQVEAHSKYKTEFGQTWSASPFLATRYDDGILHITIQDEGCRCIVASVRSPRIASPPTDGKLTDCRSTNPPPDEGKLCQSDLKVRYFDDPYLTPAAATWTEMKFRIKAGRAQGSLIEISQDGRKVVEVAGPIGYEPETSPFGAPKPTDIYFKFGHYRDYIPAAETMDIDWVKVGRTGP